jgi:hypothetical protein
VAAVSRRYRTSVSRLVGRQRRDGSLKAQPSVLRECAGMSLELRAPNQGARAPRYGRIAECPGWVCAGRAL